ncbi:hypothetical protein HRbin36_02258 [bacterium HR36]|nr:hypothetical protein HRbin36_02258 [bacterium HR36]
MPAEPPQLRDFLLVFQLLQQLPRDGPMEIYNISVQGGGNVLSLTLHLQALGNLLRRDSLGKSGDSAIRQPNTKHTIPPIMLYRPATSVSSVYRLFALLSGRLTLAASALTGKRGRLAEALMLTRCSEVQTDAKSPAETIAQSGTGSPSHALTNSGAESYREQSSKNR